MHVERLFDAHFHIVDPVVAPVENQGYLPPAFTVDDYRARVAGLPAAVVGGAVVAASFQQRDPGWLVTALDRLGPGFVGVAPLEVAAGDDDLWALHAAGVRSVRCNVRRDGRQALEDLERTAARVHDLVGWHVEVYADGAHLPDLAPKLRRLPRLCLDHLGLPVAPTHPGYRALLGLVEAGAHVKASGFGRQRMDVATILRDVDAVDPTALVFGTDLPSTRAPRPFHDDDVALVGRALGSTRAAAVLYDNAIDLYGRPGRSGRA